MARHANIRPRTLSAGESNIVPASTSGIASAIDRTVSKSIAVSGSVMSSVSRRGARNDCKEGTAAGWRSIANAVIPPRMLGEPITESRSRIISAEVTRERARRVRVVQEATSAAYRRRSAHRRDLWTSTMPASARSSRWTRARANRARQTGRGDRHLPVGDRESKYTSSREPRASSSRSPASSTRPASGLRLRTGSSNSGRERTPASPERAKAKVKARLKVAGFRGSRNLSRHLARI